MKTNAKEILNDAALIKEEIISNRRKIHDNPETGMKLEKTSKLVWDTLVKMGYEPVKVCESGIVATIAGDRDNGKCIMLRADMDALSLFTDSGKVECVHSCGHDMHTAMLLGAARILKKHKDEIGGSVKFVFQPNEEGLSGAKAMIAEGVLENPRCDAAFAIHVHSGTPSGFVLCGTGSSVMAGCINFKINVYGKGSHGATPELGIDSIKIASHIYNAIETITANEISAKVPALLSVGKFCGGSVSNVIPEVTTLEGTIRAFDEKILEKIYSRIKEISDAVAREFNGKAEVFMLSAAKPLANDEKLSKQISEFSKELVGEDKFFEISDGGMGSEDFAEYSKLIPCTYMFLGAGTSEENPIFGKPMHNKDVVFNEDILHIGAALHSYVALKWLNEN